MRKRHISLNLLHEYCFFQIHNCHLLLAPAFPAVWMLISIHFSFPGRCQPLLSLTCHPLVSTCSSIHLGFSSDLLNLCPAPNTPYSVSLLHWASSAKGCFLLTFILKIETSCWAPGYLSLGTHVMYFVLAIFWVVMAGFCVSMSIYIVFVQDDNRKVNKNIITLTVSSLAS